MGEECRRWSRCSEWYGFAHDGFAGFLQEVNGFFSINRLLGVERASVGAAPFVHATDGTAHDAGLELDVLAFYRESFGMGVFFVCHGAKMKRYHRLK